MGGYLVNFAIYTMAMTGLIFFALMMYKKFAGGGNFGKKSEFLSIEETLSVSPRKNLYVVRAGREKFLIAGDADKTTLISKLDNYTEEEKIPEMLESHYEIPRAARRSASVEDLPVISAFPKKENNVLHNMVRKISN